MSRKRLECLGGAGGVAYYSLFDSFRISYVDEIESELLFRRPFFFFGHFLQIKALLFTSHIRLLEASLASLSSIVTLSYASGRFTPPSLGAAKRTTITWYLPRTG